MFGRKSSFGHDQIWIFWCWWSAWEVQKHDQNIRNFVSTKRRIVIAKLDIALYSTRLNITMANIHFLALFLPSSILHFAALAWISWWPTNMQECWIWPSDDLLECLVMIQLPTNAFIQRHVFHSRPFIRLNLLNTRPQFIATSVCYPSRSLRFPKHKIELGIDLRLVSLNIQALLRAITII